MKQQSAESSPATNRQYRTEHDKAKAVWNIMAAIRFITH